MSDIDAASLTKQLNAHAFATRSNRVAKQPGLLEGWWARWQLWRRIRRDEALLRSQPHYLLKDVGLERGEIAAVIRNGRFI